MTEQELRKAEAIKQATEEARKYKRLFATEDGDFVFHDLERYCGQNVSSVRGQNVQPMDVAYYEGMRKVFLYIKSKIERKDLGEKENE